VSGQYGGLLLPGGSGQRGISLAFQCLAVPPYLIPYHKDESGTARRKRYACRSYEGESCASSLNDANSPVSHHRPVPADRIGGKAPYGPGNGHSW
jgi:hypothetical protein